MIFRISIRFRGRYSHFQVGSESLGGLSGQQFSLTNGLTKMKQFRVLKGQTPRGNTDHCLRLGWKTPFGYHGFRLPSGLLFGCRNRSRPGSNNMSETTNWVPLGLLLADLRDAAMKLVH